MGEVKVWCQQEHRSQTGWNQKVYDAHSHSPHQQQSEVHPCPFLLAITRTPHCPLQIRAHILEGISPLWPPLPGKTIKLFFSTSPQALSLRFDSAAEQRGQAFCNSFLILLSIATKYTCGKYGGLKMIRKYLFSTTSYPSEQPSLQSLQITSAGEGVEKKGTLLHYC